MLEGRVVLVTGGGRGIGREHCLELARHGAAVVVNDLGVGLHGEAGGESPADEVVAEIEAAGGRAVADGSSVTDWEGVGRMVARAVETFGHLDAVVNNAGILRDRMITSMVEDDWDAVVAVHMKGTFAVTKAACDHWRSIVKAGGEVTGRIINTTSGTGLFGNVGQASYGAAKAGIAGFTVIAAMEMARYGVTANAVSPIARTRMTAGLMAEQAEAASFDRGDPANSSPVVAWLASEASGWLTGAVLRVDGNKVQRVRPWEVDESTVVHSSDGGRLDALRLDEDLRRAYRILPRGTSGLSG
jgi:NAD(P)-dependent dehydrogenase (short-subunit alcohol dehydrogenase family)